MSVQSTVRRFTATGVVGELFLEGPLRAQPCRLASTSAANNVVGRAFHYLADGSGVAADSTAGTGAFAGILGNPKVYASLGTQAGGALAATLVLPNNTMGELVQEAAGLLVTVDTDPDIGDVVYAKNADGTLTTAAPSAEAPANTRAIGATVVRYPLAVAGQALIHLK